VEPPLLRVSPLEQARGTGSDVGVAEDRAQEREWVRQDNLANAGLIGAALIMVQPFLTASRLDVTAKICTVSFAVAIPLLAALILIGQQETFRQQATKSVLVTITKPVGQGSAFVGIVAGFWHITWIAGVAMLVVAFIAVGVHSAGYVRLERDTPGSKLATVEALRRRQDAEGREIRDLGLRAEREGRRFSGPELDRVEELRADIERIGRDIEALFSDGDEPTLTQRDE
jgi:hypothetical protein